MDYSIYDSVLFNNIITFSSICVFGCIMVIIGCILCKNIIKREILLVIIICIIICASIIWSIVVPEMIIDVVNNSYITYDGEIEADMYGQTAFLYINVDGKSEQLSTKTHNLQGHYTGAIVYAQRSKIILSMNLVKTEE